MPALDRAVERAEAVDHGFELRGHAVVIQRRDKHQHIRVQNLLSDLPHVVLLHAGAFIPAVDAAGAGMDVSVGCVDDLYAVSGLLRAPLEMLRQHVG